MKVILKDITGKGFCIDKKFVDEVIKKNVEVSEGEMNPQKLYANIISVFLEKYQDSEAILQNEMLQKLKIMHSKFKITAEEVPFSDKEKQFRICAMQEELDEYKKAKDPEEEFDALIDLVVFALGTAERHGWLDIFQEGFNRVMKANMDKEIGQNQKRGSFQLDLVKPEGWVAPRHNDLFGE